MRRARLIGAGCVVALAGCALNPFYDARTAIAAPFLVGRWAVPESEVVPFGDPADTVLVTVAPTRGLALRVTVKRRNSTMLSVVHVVRADTMLFLDAGAPADMDAGEDSVFTMPGPAIPVHVFAMVKRVGDTVLVAVADSIAVKGLGFSVIPGHVDAPLTDVRPGYSSEAFMYLLPQPSDSLRRLLMAIARAPGILHPVRLVHRPDRQ